MYSTGYHSNLGLGHATFLVYELLDNTSFPHHSIETVLDVGCSHGKAVKQLWEGGLHANGVDISTVAIALANKARRAGMRCVASFPCFQAAAASALPFPDRSFDAVLSSDVLEHVETNEVSKVVAELARVTTKLILLKIASGPSTEGAGSELRKLKGKGLAVPDNLHLTQKPSAFWIAAFEKVGFALHHRLEDHAHMTWIKRFPHMCWCAAMGLDPRP